MCTGNCTEGSNPSLSATVNPEENQNPEELIDDSVDESLDDPTGARRDNLLRLRRLERLAAVDPTLPLKPALAVARGLERVLAGNVEEAVELLRQGARHYG